MEISLEKIELVKDRTGVSYKEAKEALIRADGNVVDAIIVIEDDIDIKPRSKAGGQVFGVVDRIKEIIRTGNVSRIIIKKDEETILNIPVSFGVLGAVLVPWTTIAATAAALGSDCAIEILKEDGEILDISGTAKESFCEVKESGSAIVGDIKDKSGDALSQVKDKVSGVINRVRPGQVEGMGEIIYDSVELSDLEDEDDDPDGRKEFMREMEDAAESEEKALKEKLSEMFRGQEDTAESGEEPEPAAFDPEEDDYFNLDDEYPDFPEDSDADSEGEKESEEDESEEDGKSESEEGTLEDTASEEEIESEEETVPEEEDNTEAEEKIEAEEETEAESAAEEIPEEEVKSEEEESEPPKSSLSFKIDESEFDDEYDREHQSAAEMIDEALRSSEELKEIEEAEDAPDAEGQETPEEPGEEAVAPEDQAEAAEETDEAGGTEDGAAENAENVEDAGMKIEEAMSNYKSRNGKFTTM